DDATDSVDMTLTCSSGSVTTNPVAATEASPAVFEITGAMADATCTATEAATPGYSQNIDGCQAGGLLADGGSCTMVNTLTNGTFTVIKDFSDDNPGPVDITLTCSGGDITTNPLPAAEGAPAFFEITGFEFGVTCTATEAATPGYDQDISQCQAPDLSANGGSCTMVNTLREGTFTVRKIFSDDNPMSVSVTASCTSGMVTNNPQPASMGGSAIFNVTGFEDGATCTATEVVPSGYEADISDCQDGDPINGGCAITNTLIPRTTFRVLKDFTDDNPMDVEVTIDCFTGLPITQTQSINEQQDVVFIVESFEPGELNCEISEVVPTGYTPTYTASLGVDGMSNVPPYSDADGCYFDEVINGEFICEIVNEPNLVDIVIEKLWIIEGMGGDAVDQNFRLTLYCDAQIVGGQANCGGGPGPVMAGGPIPAYQTCLVMNGYGNEIFTPQARPDYPSSHCWVVETVYDDSVEVDNGCLNLEISAAEGGDSCLITNTVFFEGIPTLNQYGMLLLALLMLGVGLVGFRRFA
ncbi:MAG TPA: IPTL-CTERM sorting domain-containing protein, partial [Xanthomonadales bacterium]|nr:IPTL-CTERM sorting domain-containing protein [Xanthomonadales bacterium]